MMRERFAALVVPAFLGGLALILGKLGASAAGPVTADPVQLLTPEPVGGPFPVAPPPVDGFADGLTDPPTPILRMKMRVPETAAIGQELTYRIRIENVSPADALHVVIRDAIPENAKFVRAEPEARIVEKELSWDIGTLEGCHYKEITLVLAPTGSGDVRNCARVQFEHGQCTTTHIGSPEVSPVISPNLSIEKRGPTTAVLGETLDYQIIVTNFGPTPINDLTLYDQLPDGLQHVGSERPGGQRVWPVRKSLAPGESWRESYQIITRELGKQCNKAIVAAGDLKKETESCVTVIERKVDLEFIQLPKEPFAGVPTPYQLRLTNKGKDAVTSLVLSANVPGPGYFVSANAGGQLASPGEVRWMIDNLPAGESRTFQYVIVTQKLGEVVLRASAGSNRGVEARAEAKVTLARISDPEGLYFEVVQEPGAVTVGENTTYLINVVNHGRAPLTNVRLSALVPVEMDIVATKPTTAKIKGQQVDFDAFNAQPGSTFSYQVQVKAKKEGEGVIFDAKMSADQRQKEIHKQQAKTILPKE